MEQIWINSEALLQSAIIVINKRCYKHHCNLLHPPLVHARSSLHVFQKIQTHIFYKVSLLTEGAAPPQSQPESVQECSSGS